MVVVVVVVVVCGMPVRLPEKTNSDSNKKNESLVDYFDQNSIDSFMTMTGAFFHSKMAPPS